MKISKELREKYVGKKVHLYPSDTYKKIAIIKDLDEYGWTFEFIEGTRPESDYRPGDVAFFNHAKVVVFKFI